MLILHRITPFCLFFVLALGSLALLFSWGSPLIVAALMLLCSALLFARLLEWTIRTASFWFLFGTPILFLICALGTFFFLESTVALWVLAVVLVLVPSIFAEQLFAYVHAPVRYQPYTIEYFSLIFTALTTFFLTTTAFGLRLFLQAPLLILVLLVFLATGFLFSQTFWGSKIDPVDVRKFGLLCALLTTELFAVMTFLPTGFYANAALITVLVYLLVGLVRAHLLKKLSQTVIRRYLIVGISLSLLILLTARWV